MFLAAALLAQEDFPEIQRFQQAWPRENLETLHPLAEAVVRALENPEPTIDPYRNRWVVDVLIRAKDEDLLKRLETAFERKGDARSQARALETRGERIAATGTLDALVAHLQEKLKPPAGKRLDPKSLAFESFLERVYKAGKLRTLFDRLMETPADHVDFRFHADVITKTPSWYQSNSERNEMHQRLREKEKGPVDILPAERILVATQCADEKKFAVALEKARAILAGGGSLTNEERASTEQVIARCLIESGDASGAASACDRGLATTRTQVLPLLLLKARARLTGSDASGATAAWREAFDSVEHWPDPERRWDYERWMAAGIRSELTRWKDCRTAVADACGAGDLFVLAAEREVAGDPAGAAEAFDRLFKATPGNRMIVFERTRLRASAGQWAQAVAARLDLLPIEAAHSDRKRGRRLEGLPELEKRLITGCEESGAWDALKELGLGFSAEPGCHNREVEEILYIVHEPDYLEAVEKSGLASAKNEMQRWWALDPVILAGHRLGWNEQTTRRLKGITVEGGFELKTVELADSWLEDFSRPEARRRDPLDIVRHLVKDAPDAPLSFRGPFDVDPKELSRSWRAGVRSGSADPIPWRLGALLGVTDSERIACLERIAAAPTPPPPWKARLGIALLDSGQEPRARELFIGMIRSKSDRAAAGAELEASVARLPRALSDDLAKEFERVDAVGWAWSLSGKRPESEEKQIELLDRWWSRAPEGAEQLRAGAELTKVLAQRAQALLNAGRAADAAALWERAAEVTEDANLRLSAFQAYLVAGDDVGAQRIGFALLPVRRDFVLPLLRETLLRRGPELWKELRAMPRTALASHTEAAIRREMKALRDDRPEIRDEGSLALRARGAEALPFLLDGLDDPDAEYRSRMQDLILDALLGLEPGLDD